MALAGPPRSGRLVPMDAVLGTKLAAAPESAAAAQAADTVSRQPSRTAWVRRISSSGINALYSTSDRDAGAKVPRRTGRKTLERLGGEIRQPRAFAAHQRDMSRVRPALETVDNIGQAAGGLGQIGGIDLGDIAQADQLAARTGSRYQRLHLLGGQVLGLIEDDESVEKCAPAHEIERADFDPVAQQIIGGCAAPVAALVAAREHLQVIHEGAHPGLHLLL